MFKTELEMSKMFEKFLKLNYGNSYIKEYQGLFGIPDFVFYSKANDEISIVSFELKLKDWKKAAKQAFRYRSFSNVSYVVISSECANPALNNIDVFERYNIGLAKFDSSNGLEILYKPGFAMPFSDNLNQRLLNNIGGSRKKSKNFKMLAY